MEESSKTVSLLANMDTDSFNSEDEMNVFSDRKWTVRRHIRGSHTLALNRRRSVKRVVIPVLAVSLILSICVNVVLITFTSKSGAPVECDNTTSNCFTVTEAMQGSHVHKYLDAQLGVPSVAPCATDLPPVSGGPGAKENIFVDLSAEEIDAVYQYLLGQAELKIIQSSKNGEGSVYGIELHVPNKSAALNFMDGSGPKPPRESNVIIKHLDRKAPVVVEYVVGPLPSPTYHYRNPRREKLDVPYRFHPTYGVKAAYNALISAMSKELITIIEESYGASFIECKDRCLIILPQKTSSAYSDRTIILLYITYKTEFPTVNTVGMMFLMKETPAGDETFECESMFYGGQYFTSIQEFTRAYSRGEVTKSKMSFPEPKRGQSSQPSTMNIRGKTFPQTSQAGPREYEPDGRRYRVTDQHIEHMEWSLNYRISTVSGPQVWDVRWSGERIAYEISLQDLGVIYGGANPVTFYSHLSDSAFGLGNKAYGLMPGVDCPEHATFLPQYVFDVEANKAVMKHNAFCVFEHNTGVPLRRHNSNEEVSGRNYGGLVDRVLVVRTIIVEFNYDYIFDMIFHQNGAIEVKSYATGYLMSQVYQEAEKRFGFRITDNIVGSIHHHLFNFKLDLDIKGQSNRYETLDLALDERTWPWHKSGQEIFQQLSFRHSLKETEQQAAYKYNFSTPKYHIVYNDKERNEFGVHRSYRIAVEGFSKVVFPENSPILASRRWSKYQMLTTRRRDEEEASSSMFSMFDGASPHVDIDRYLRDDESIVDQDLVFWVSVGFHHIPHTEDIPNTPTVGTQATISLLPYNYFYECPSVGSRDAVRADLREGSVVFQDYGTPLSSQCLPTKLDTSHLQNKSYLFP